MRSLPDRLRHWRLTAFVVALVPGLSWAQAPEAAQGMGLSPVPGLDDDEEGDVPPPDPSAPTVASAATAPAENPPTGTRTEPAAAEPLAVPDLTALRAEPVRGVPSSGFGWRDDPIRHRSRYHRGGDFRAPRGTPVYAAGGGTVTFCGRRHGYGKVIDILHDGGVLTRYAHLSAIEVERGQRVEVDALIGRVGSTGRATGPHLHFEVRIEGRAVDPTEAMRVAELQRNDGPDTVEVTRLAALALCSSASTAVSAIDPPRSRHTVEKARAGERHRWRRPNVS